MKRAQIQLEEETYEALRHRAFSEKRSVAAVIREILRKDMAASCSSTSSSIRDFSFVASGRSKQGPLKPVSEHHDEALAKAFGK